MTNIIERVARAIYEEDDPWHKAWPWPDMNVSQGSADVYRRIAEAAIKAMREPTDEQWDGLARQIVMWMDMQPKTPMALFTHLDRAGYEIPKWLSDEPEMKSLDHVPSKGTRAVLIYKAMIDAALTPKIEE